MYGFHLDVDHSLHISHFHLGEAKLQRVSMRTKRRPARPWESLAWLRLVAIAWRLFSRLEANMRKQSDHLRVILVSWIVTDV